MRKVAVAASRRWIAIVLIVVVGLLQLHLPHYLAETSTAGDYARLPGVVLVATIAGSVVAAVAIQRGLRAGWLLGIGFAATSFVLYIVQEAVGLPGLEQKWWEPTRMLSLLLAVLFTRLACRSLGSPRHHPSRPTKT